jgi:hypothetical protein
MRTLPTAALWGGGALEWHQSGGSANYWSFAGVNSPLPDQFAKNFNVWPGVSNVHGLGLFARRNFAPGEEIFTIYRHNDDVELGRAELMKLPENLRNFICMRFPCEGRKAIISRELIRSDRCQIGELMFLFINASINPNASRIYQADREMLMALCPIKSEEEIFFDYTLESCQIDYFAWDSKSSKTINPLNRNKYKSNSSDCRGR